MGPDFLTRVGVVGAGFGQHVLVPAFRLDPRCQVTAIAASSQDKADRVASELGLSQAFGGWRGLVESPDIDVVAISVPPMLQPPIAAAAVQAGKPVLCEKPLGAGLNEVAELARAAANSGVANMVDFLFPEIPAWATAKEVLERGDIGHLRHIDLTWSVETYANRMGLDSWKIRSAEGGGALSNFFSQCFYYLEWFAGPILRLSANLVPAPGPDAPGDRCVDMSLEFQSGMKATAHVDTAAPQTHVHRLTFQGDDGAMVLENTAADYVNGFRLARGTRELSAMRDIAVAGNFGDGVDGRIAATAKLSSRLIDWTQAGVASAPSIADGLRVQILLDRARAAHESGGWAEVGPRPGAGNP